jgi:hypothetical protein
MKKIILIATIAMISFAISAWLEDIDVSHDMSRMSMNPSKDEREKMATAHTQMANCLRTEKEFIQCRDELRKECQSMNNGFCSGIDMEKNMYQGKKHRK